MGRKEKIFQCVCNLVEEQDVKMGVDSVDVSEKLGLDRSNVSRDLNELTREGRVVKLSGRPVRYIQKSAYDHELNMRMQKEESSKEKIFLIDQMIGKNGSLKTQIEQGKSAILYPPRGLHTLLVGPTGTGKTTFAEKMFDYAVKAGVIFEKKEFVVFNCAEYSQNPQLILSQLFGHRKGAFTGAEKDKQGLVERANGGILFLDEIHRLPPEGQEMLFLLMDKGIYRKLGETDQFHKASVLIVGATTENVNTALLKTFLRRMPVVIRLPALNERPISERLQLIEYFFSNEQKKIGVSIRVYKEVIIALLLYRCPGNIGQLQADIQLLCAQAFLQYKVKNMEYVTIDLNTMPEYIHSGRLEHQRNDLVDFLRYSDDYHIFEGTEKNEDGGESLYDIISSQYCIFKQQGHTARQITGILQEDLNQYMDHLKDKYRVTDQEENTKKLLKIIDTKVYYAAEEAIQFAEVRLDRKLSERAKIGLIMHVNAMIDRLEKGILPKGEELDEIIVKHPKEFRVAKIILRLLEEELGVNIPKQELEYLTMFLCIDDEQVVKRVGVLVIAHGKSTASSMADVANQLMDTEHCKAIDMPLDVSVETTLDKTIETVCEIDEGKGVIVLADMGSLTMIGELVSRKTSVKIKTIAHVSTAIVLEAVRKSLMQGVTLDEIYKDLKEMEVMRENSYENNWAREDEYRIIATCFTGKGTALKIKKIINEMLPDTLNKRVSIQCMDFKQASDVKKSKKELKRKRIHAVVGTVDLQLDGVPFISVDELIVGSGIRRLEKLISGEEADYFDKEKQTRGVELSVLIEALKGMLSFLNPDKLVPLIYNSFDKMMNGEQKKNCRELQVRYVIHTACMFERILQGEILTNKQTEKLMDIYQVEFGRIRESLFEVENMLNIRIPDSELSYLVEMIVDEKDEPLH